MNKNPKIAFFGGEPLGLPALQALIQAGLVPAVVFCNPDRPHGRGQVLQPPAIKTFATGQTIPVIQPSNFKDKEDFSLLIDEEWDLFVVVAYNFILPAWLLALPKHGVINVHPSLLPKLRGASPIRTAILENTPEEVGISIMLMDEKMDHGPLLSQIPYVPSVWPLRGPALDTELAVAGASLLTTTIPTWLAGNITPQPQAHEMATYTKKITKEHAELAINPLSLPTGAEARVLYHKILALTGNPGTFFYYHDKRVKITEVTLTDGDILQLQKVVPEGRSETTFASYLQSLAR
jgi:methionyl-tRNA formyltransferase